MSEATAKRLVLLAMLVTAAVDVAGGGSGTFKRVWNAGVVGVLLSVASDFAPALAGPFALLVTLAVLTGPGQKTLNGILATIGNTVAPGANVNPATNAQAAGPPAPTTTGR